MTSDRQSSDSAEKDASEDRGRFAATRWSVVLQAGQVGDGARVALETLCRTYWHPLYVYVRGRGYSRQDAEDMTQAFLVHLMDGDAIARADPARGRFRSFLLAGMSNFLADEWDKSHAQKRGGGRVFAMDFQGAETWIQGLASSDITPEQAYEKRWALTLLEQVYQRLQNQYEAKGKQALFDTLKIALAGPSAAAPYPRLAETLQMSEGAVRVAIHRLRRDYRELLRDTITDLVEDPAEVEDELRHLQMVLSRGKSSGNTSAEVP